MNEKYMRWREWREGVKGVGEIDRQWNAKMFYSLIWTWKIFQIRKVVTG